MCVRVTYDGCVCRHIVRQWRENVQWYRVQRDMFTTALDHFEMTTCRKVITQHSYRDLHTHTLLKIHHILLFTVWCVQCFSWWREQTMTSLDTAWRERERLCEISSTLAQSKEP